MSDPSDVPEGADRPSDGVPSTDPAAGLRHAGDETSGAPGARGEAYQAAQRASPWGYLLLVGVAGLLTGIAWYKVEEETGIVTQAWIFLSALCVLAPIAWHAVDVFQSAVSRRGGAFLNVVLTILLGLVVMVVASVMNVRLRQRLPAKDLTDSGRYTLGEETRKVLAKLPKDSVVYATYLERRGSATTDGLRESAFEQLKVYTWESPQVTLRRFDELREKDAARDWLLKVGVDSTSSGEGDDLLVLTYAEAGREVARGRQKEIRIEDATFRRAGSADGQQKWLGERVITSAIQDLVFVKLKAYATAGHGEKSLREELSQVRDRLRSQNVEVVDKPLDLSTSAKVPDDCDILLVAGPSVAFEPQEAEAIRLWLEKGRALFLTLDVDETGKRRETGLEGILDSFGIAPRINYVVFAPMEVNAGDLGTAFQPTMRLKIQKQDYADHPAVEALRRGGGFATVLHASSYLEVGGEPREGLTIDPLIWAPDPGLRDIRPWAAQVSADRRQYDRPVEGRDRTGVRLALAAAATRELTPDPSGTQRDARLVVVADTDVFDNQAIAQNAPNADLFGGLSYWALRRSDLASVSEKTLDLEYADIRDREHRMAFWWPFVVAVCALVAGAGVWWGRRR